MIRLQLINIIAQNLVLSTPTGPLLKLELLEPTHANDYHHNVLKAYNSVGSRGSKQPWIDI